MTNFEKKNSPSRRFEEVFFAIYEKMKKLKNLIKIDRNWWNVKPTKKNWDEKTISEAQNQN